MAVATGSSERLHLDAFDGIPEAAPAATAKDHPSLHRRERSSLLKNRMREICTSGSVRGGDGNIPAYSAPMRSYRNTVKRLVALLRHDDASRVTPEDVILFKDHRLAEVNPRTGRPISPKTVKGADLAGLKAVFSWAVNNRHLPSNPAAGVTLKVGKRPRLRSPGFTDNEARAILSAAHPNRASQEHPKDGSGEVVGTLAMCLHGSAGSANSPNFGSGTCAGRGALDYHHHAKSRDG